VSGEFSLGQPPVSAERLDSASGALKRYRFMAFTTGVVLILGCLALIMKALDVPHMEPATAIIWVAHGYLFLVYVVITAMLGIKLRWPLPRYALVMAAGTIPTMSFVAEHFVTRAARKAAAEPVG
jgi:integral membrane protein